MLSKIILSQVKCGMSGRFFYCPMEHSTVTRPGQGSHAATISSLTLT